MLETCLSMRYWRAWRSCTARAIRQRVWKAGWNFLAEWRCYKSLSCSPAKTSCLMAKHEAEIPPTTISLPVEEKSIADVQHRSQISSKGRFKAGYVKHPFGCNGYSRETSGSTSAHPDVEEGVPSVSSRSHDVTHRSSQRSSNRSSAKREGNARLTSFKTSRGKV